jgi:hypothetical protein
MDIGVTISEAARDLPISPAPRTKPIHVNVSRPRSTLTLHRKPLQRPRKKTDEVIMNNIKEH